MAHGILAVLVVVILFGLLWGTGILCAFYPRLIQHAILSAPKPKLRLFTRPEQKILGIGGRDYYESDKYILTLRVIGFANLAVGLLLLLLFLGVVPHSG
jgi:hypothetical protein